MDDQKLMNIASTVAIAIGGWFALGVWGAVKELRSDLHKLEIDLPKNYVSRFDMDKRMEHIETMFQRIYDKLDGKADK